MGDKVRISASLMEKSEVEEWKEQMLKDGFTKLWTWICWIVRQHVIKQNEKESQKTSQKVS